MAPVNRVVQLLATEAATLERFDHDPTGAHADPERERATRHAINFVETGSFAVRTTRAWRQVTLGEMFVTAPGLEFSCAHASERPTDRCLSVAVCDDLVEQARGSLRLPRAPVQAIGNRQSYLRHQLATCVRGDEARLEALVAALLWSLGSPVRQPLFRPERLAWYAARVQRAKELIALRYAEPLSLSVLARDAGMSLFHFARVFAELEGCPPHRLLREVRLQHAMERLGAGANVTETCFAVGFGSLSHFVTAFRRKYGITPSRVARGQRTGQPRPE